MIRILLFAALIACIGSCKSGYSYRDISTFHIDTSRLHYNDPVEVIYVSGGPDYNNQQEYFYHLVVVSLKSGDTINLLTPILPIHMDANDRVRNFIPYESSMGNEIMRSTAGSIGADTSVLPHVDSIVLKKIDKVVVNAKFEEAANNRYPAILGFLSAK